MKAALAVLTVLAAVWHVHVPAAGLAVPVPAVIAAAALAGLVGLVLLAVRAAHGFRSAPWPRQARPVPSGGAA